MTNKEAIEILKKMQEDAMWQYNPLAMKPNSDRREWENKLLKELNNEINALIKAIEAIKEAEQKKGKWLSPSRNPEYVNKEFFYDCSICGFTTMDKAYFCPNCRAKMEMEG